MGDVAIKLGPALDNSSNAGILFFCENELTERFGKLYSQGVDTVGGVRDSDE